MSLKYFSSVAVGLGCQAGLIAASFHFNSSAAWIIRGLVICALVLPFVGYLLAFHKAPMLSSCSQRTRWIVLSLLSSAASAVGFCISLGVVFFLLMAFGGHHW
jgi:hypothetical protein